MWTRLLCRLLGHRVIPCPDCRDHTPTRPPRGYCARCGAMAFCADCRRAFRHEVPFDPYATEPEAH